MSHESSVGASDEWYTPPYIFTALNEVFDLDPCSPGKDHWVPAKNIFTKNDNGLSKEWNGFVFMNPPFGGRNGHVPWLEKFLNHGNGIAIVRAYTSSGWFHEHAIKAHAMLFPAGKTKFVRPDGSIGKAPGHGIVFLAVGERGKQALKNSRLGMYVEPTKEKIMNKPVAFISDLSLNPLTNHNHLIASPIENKLYQFTPEQLQSVLDALLIADKDLCNYEHSVSGGDDEINIEPTILNVRAAIALLKGMK